MVPTINVLSQNKKDENDNFYSCEILLYIAWACLRNVLYVSFVVSMKSSLSLKSDVRSPHTFNYVSLSANSFY